MSHRIIYGKKIFRTIKSAAAHLGLSNKYVRLAIDKGYQINGEYLRIYDGPVDYDDDVVEIEDEEKSSVKVSRSDGPLIKKPITHGVGVLRR